MSTVRLWRDAKDLYRSFVDLLIFDDPGEEAGYELALSARRFSENTQAVVDDKLNFSATLMRAGEVDAANRLLAEFERDVREEEAALIERVNEVKVAEAVRREGLTRVRLARVLAVALVGSSLLTFSAAGMALAGFVRDRVLFDEGDGNRVRVPETVEGAVAVAQADNEVLKPKLKHIRIGNVELMLTASQLRTLRDLAGGTPNESGLHDIIGLLPEQLAEKV
ncbi:MAG TPA: hypothetical protein VNP73_05545, partial [Actinomycetota bacterium]|nr:hypothetical protein [Actinomycetota bacterium]